MAGSTPARPWGRLGPAIGPIGDGGDTGWAEGVAAENGDERVLVVGGYLGVAKVTDPQAVVLRDAGDHDNAALFHLGSDARFGGEPSTVGLAVCNGSHDEPQVVPTPPTQTLCVEMCRVVATHTGRGVGHRPIPRLVSW